MAAETALWSWLKQAKYAMKESVDLRRVEDAMGAGFPDVDGLALLPSSPLPPFTVEPFAFKLELKSEERPARPTTNIPFKVKKRFAQCEFMRRRYTMGENAYYFLQVGSASEARRYIAPGDVGARLLKGVTESELAVICATENGMVFNHKARPQEIIEGIRKCSLRRFFQ